MDLNTITDIARPRDRSGLPPFREGDAILGGGTWLFSEPQRTLRRLVDLAGLGWPPIENGAQELRLSATCTLAALDAHAADAPWAAAALVRRCCRSLWGSFKIWNMATVGGNLCLALPAAPMAALAVALDAVCEIWCPDGTDRLLPASGLILAPQRTVLAPGEVLRALRIGRDRLHARYAVRQASLTEEGRSAALLAGRCTEAGGLALTITASVPRPLRLDFADAPAPDVLRAAVEAAGAAAGWYDDPHGAPDWRRHMTLRLAEQIRAELAT
ncbi:FAD binding domain-containing protein [Rhizosaccharibacter radicis]|uniref:FAD binding domain-containing protein n=1 Tax=Rhizosaccharibacter radicis TaxID=2782605 RepID=A0ABT1VYV2_9PROT|nr:FAD binding domain-containing protein [Acetobacteraceae bacterium KSS12]